MYQDQSQAYHAYYPTYYSQRSVLGTIDTKQALAAAGLGFVVGGSAALGVNLHKVRANQMPLNDAVVDAVAKGAGASVATATATAAGSAVGGTGLLKFAVTFATATGVVYLLHSIGNRGSGEVVVPSKKSK